jgi:hypothetical protein
MHWLEAEMKRGSVVTEMTSADKLLEIQKYSLRMNNLKIYFNLTKKQIF